ncbi:hypothetical protein CMV_026907 [Castanea mollissima]|uniref:Uncharacterized protein n=1 Tax=Castanea mollissima TaxID=60419 RepID=A0A8J4Q798_9ROSI|nr:hypothetical protein CMV_026907 [Castanea mollissima]
MTPSNSHLTRSTKTTITHRYRYLPYNIAVNSLFSLYKYLRLSSSVLSKLSSSTSTSTSTSASNAAKQNSHTKKKKKKKKNVNKTQNPKSKYLTIAHAEDPHNRKVHFFLHKGISVLIVILKVEEVGS